MVALLKTWWFWLILILVFLAVYFVTKHYSTKTS